ncbi:prepilin peptidase [Leptospira wolffii]|uniref:Peptidase n=1 Tax=Leptospira wolffii TaxID=409998 RepID=A0A2M9ZCU7_9LEPT|nr:A24 family peptidase [Leptospira wolffii]PJZ66194.1 peptidase [Leptospira wolffii]TGK60253.1 prepilin peptidase [Leptospira wolffii]TGK72595.1 prepilin peptidase [Leptospira wolffii]TGK76260.1 prepilin peptidase [Leptospira wolffii]TGL30512.1 prepilin peptidase [Leptospira wolffii]
MSEFYSEFPGLVFVLWIGGFFIASAFGSFYSTMAYRILRFYYGRERKIGSGLFRFRKILLEPSSCESCGKKLSPSELVPIFGYWISGKKCENCGSSISPLYSLTEAGFGFLFVISFYLSSNFYASLVFVILCGHLLIAGTTDARKFSLDYENLPFILFFGGLLNYLLFGSLPEKSDWIVFACFLAIFFIVHFVFPSGMGFADAIFAPSFAFLCGHPWWIFFINAAYALAVSVTVVTRKKGQSLRGVPIPMGVYFSIALALTFLVKMASNSGLLPSLFPSIL